MVINSKNDAYTIGDLVAENSRFRLRSCTNSSGRELLFQVAVDVSKNGKLSSNALALTKLKAASDKINEQTDKQYGYEFGFPELCDSVILHDQGSRCVNIIGFRNVDKVSSLIPLVKIWKDSLRVDLRTSAWIMGKLLKIISFAYDSRIRITDISGNNVLIEPDAHYVIVFDWSNAVFYTVEDNIQPSEIREDIKTAAKLVIKVLGEDLEAARVNDADIVYTNYLKHLAEVGETDVHKTHRIFYEIVDALCDNPDSVWERGFYNFVTLSRN